MFCPNCGTKNDDDALFCGSCGTKLQDKAVVPPVDNDFKPDIELVQAEVQNVAQTYAQPEEQTQTQTYAQPEEQAQPQAYVQPEEQVQSQQSVQAGEHTQSQPYTQQNIYGQPQMPNQQNMPEYQAPGQQYYAPVQKQKPPKKPFKVINTTGSTCCSSICMYTLASAFPLIIFTGDTYWYPALISLYPNTRKQSFATNAMSYPLVPKSYFTVLIIPLDGIFILYT